MDNRKCLVLQSTITFFTQLFIRSAFKNICNNGNHCRLREKERLERKQERLERESDTET